LRGEKAEVELANDQGGEKKKAGVAYRVGEKGRMGGKLKKEQSVNRSKNTRCKRGKEKIGKQNWGERTPGRHNMQKKREKENSLVGQLQKKRENREGPRMGLKKKT